MESNILDNLAEHVHVALKAAFSELISGNPSQSFYAFAVFTDDSLQFLSAAANTEEALTATVKRYRETVDPKYGCTATLANMRWSHGDWVFFGNVGDMYFEEIDKALFANIHGPEEEFDARIDSLWDAVLRGFQRLDQEGFFGSGPERSKITLMVVGDLSLEFLVNCVRVLNPPEVVNRFVNWDNDAPDNIIENR